MKLKLAFAVAVFGLASSTPAQSVVIGAYRPAPAARIGMIARFTRDTPISREFVVQAIALAGAWTMDATSTHQWITSCATCVEIGGLANGSRSTAKIMGENAALDAGMIVIAYEWKKRVHNKYLHPFWRVPMAFQAEAHMSAAIGNWRTH